VEETRVPGENHQPAATRCSWWFSPGTLDSTNNKLCQRVTAGWWFSPGTLVSSTNNKLLQRVAAGWWFSPGTLVSSTNKTDRHDITEILLNVVLTTTNLP
jgi:hypothetical protein